MRNLDGFCRYDEEKGFARGGGRQDLVSFWLVWTSVSKWTFSTRFFESRSGWNHGTFSPLLFFFRSLGTGYHRFLKNSLQFRRALPPAVGGTGPGKIYAAQNKENADTAAKIGVQLLGGEYEILH